MKRLSFFTALVGLFLFACTIYSHQVKAATTIFRQHASGTSEQAKALKVLHDIFEDYKSNEEGIDSEDNKNAVTKSLLSLKKVTNPGDLELLINYWQYYDPTDYSCKQLILNVLLQDRAKSIAAVRHRMKNKKSWETGATEFKYLLDALESK